MNVNPFGELMFALSVVAGIWSIITGSYNDMCYYAGSALILGSIVFK